MQGRGEGVNYIIIIDSKLRQLGIMNQIKIHEFNQIVGDLNPDFVEIRHQLNEDSDSNDRIRF